MASLKRCDQCKKLSDEPGIGYIGREFDVRFYQDKLLTIKSESKDYCVTCVKKIVTDHSVSEGGSRDIY